jgi:hypothetical protein
MVDYENCSIAAATDRGLSGSTAARDHGCLNPKKIVAVHRPLSSVFAPLVFGQFFRRAIIVAMEDLIRAGNRAYCSAAFSSKWVKNCVSRHLELTTK